jgi:hypothetical protein
MRISDLDEVKNIDSYRSSGDNSERRATSVVAKALMAKTYLWVKDFANAESILADIVNHPDGLDLEEFDVLYHPDKPVNKEIIFSINYERVNGFLLLPINLYPMHLLPERYIPMLHGSLEKVMV